MESSFSTARERYSFPPPPSLPFLRVGVRIQASLQLCLQELTALVIYSKCKHVNVVPMQQNCELAQVYQNLETLVTIPQAAVISPPPITHPLPHSPSFHCPFLPPSFYSWSIYYANCHSLFSKLEIFRSIALLHQQPWHSVRPGLMNQYLTLIPSFRTIPYTRTERHRGGLLLYMSEDVPPTSLHYHSTLDLLFVELKL